MAAIFNVTRIQLCIYKTEGQSPDAEVIFSFMVIHNDEYELGHKGLSKLTDINNKKVLSSY
jgi:hypothetical protein